LLAPAAVADFRAVEGALDFRADALAAPLPDAAFAVAVFLVPDADAPLFLLADLPGLLVAMRLSRDWVAPS
jgi:hypothetical protein